MKTLKVCHDTITNRISGKPGLPEQQWRGHLWQTPFSEAARKGYLWQTTTYDFWKQAGKTITYIYRTGRAGAGLAAVR